MLAQCLEIVLTAIDAAHGWFMDSFNKMGTLKFWFTAVIIWTVYRFILAPLFGLAHVKTLNSFLGSLHSGSDTADHGIKGQRRIES